MTPHRPATHIEVEGDKPKVARSRRKLSDSLPKKAKDLVVEVRRDSFGGDVFSQVRDRNRDIYDWKPEGGPLVVIDRQKGRHMDSETIQSRAESLAALLGLPYNVDLTWACAADQGQPCRCPKCVDTTLRRCSS